MIISECKQVKLEVLLRAFCREVAQQTFGEITLLQMKGRCVTNKSCSGISSFFVTKFLKASYLEMSSVCKYSRTICKTAVSNEVQPLFSNQQIELQLHHLFSHKQDVLGVPGQSKSRLGENTKS